MHFLDVPIIETMVCIVTTLANEEKCTIRRKRNVYNYYSMQLQYSYTDNVEQFKVTIFHFSLI